MAEFIRGDIAKIQEFIAYKDEAKVKFAEIRNEFDKINQTLLKNWDGYGAAAYSRVAEHITENVNGISDVLDTIVEELLVDLAKTYEDMDSALEEYNRTAGQPQDETIE